MRFFSLLFLILLVAAVAIFAWQNHQAVTLTFLQWSISANIPIILFVTFLAGMLSGWSLLGAIRRSVSRSAEYLDRPSSPPPHKPAA